MTKREEMKLAARGEGCLGQSAEDEPVFILCGRDPDAAATIRYWANLREDRLSDVNGLDQRQQDKLAEARAHSRRMLDFSKRRATAEGTSEPQ